MIDIYKHAQNVLGNISVFVPHALSTAMAPGEEGDSDTKFICPVHDLPTDVQAEVDEHAARLGADDLEPLQTLAVQQFETYLPGVDHIIKDVITNEQLRTAWDNKQFVLLMKNYVETKQTANALGFCVSLNKLVCHFCVGSIVIVCAW